MTLFLIVFNRKERVLSRIQIIVEADEPALFFSSRQAAERYMEAIDVKDGVYKRAFGSGGERFDVTLHEDRPVLISRSDLAPQPDVLRQIINEFLSKVGIEQNGDEPLSSLIMKSEKFLES